ncbi:MAG: phosphotransferase [Anaerolineae bacterium]
MPPADDRFNQVVRRFYPQSRLLRVWPMTGGVSAQVTALEIVHADGQTQKLLIRQHGALDLQHNPHIAADEFKLLNLLQTLGIRAPKPYHVDESGTLLPTPYIVVEFVDGVTEFAPAHLDDCIAQFAAQLTRIHRADCSRYDLSFLPQQNILYRPFPPRPPQLDASIDEGRIRAALEAACPLPQHNASTLLHGDYWPGNILWREGQLVAVIDWEDSAFGDPLADVGSARLEVLWAFGSDAMHAFTQHYQTLNPISVANLPYWDLRASLRPAFKIAEWASDAAAEKAMRDTHRAFVTQALNQLP